MAIAAMTEAQHFALTAAESEGWTFESAGPWGYGSLMVAAHHAEYGDASWLIDMDGQVSVVARVA